MFIIGIIVLGGLALYIFLASYLYKSSKVKYPKNRFLPKIVLAIFILLPTYDIVITNVLSGYYCLIASPNPKTLIEKKVEYPKSIYWEDNVYPGFSKEDRKLMIQNYLDAEHLKTMALNGDDGKIYVYQLEKEQRAQIKKKIIHITNVAEYYEAYAKEIMKTEKVYTKESMPKLNYTVTFNEIKLNSFARKFLYSDETKVIENNTSRVIAYNRRYMHFFYNIFPDFELGDRYYVPEAMCGESYFWFTHRVFNYKPIEVTSNHKIDLNKYLYKKYIKGEK